MPIAMVDDKGNYKEVIMADESEIPTLEERFPGLKGLFVPEAALNQSQVIVQAQTQIDF